MKHLLTLLTLLLLATPAAGQVTASAPAPTIKRDLIGNNDLVNTGVTSASGLVGDACEWGIGDNDELRLANASAGDFLFDDEDFTACALVYPDLGTPMYIFGVGSGTTGSWMARMTGSGGGRYSISTDGSDMTVAFGPNFSDETWHSICISYDSSDDEWLRALNGDTTPNVTAHSGGAHGESTLDFVVGNDDEADGGQDFSGMIDEIWILNDSITDIEEDTGVWVQECHWNDGNGRAFADRNECNP